MEERFLFEIYDKVYDLFKKVGFEELTETEKVFWCVWELEADVNNDGFDGYFFSISGNHAMEAIDSLEKIGAFKTADIVRRASKVFKDGKPPKDCNLRQDQLCALPDSTRAELNTIDEEFFKYEENLSQLLYNFVKTHPSDFLLN